MKYWLFKTEPESFSIDDLAKSKKQTTCWDGVRNYQARNFIRDEMSAGDRVLLYHSNANPPGIVGLCEIVREAYPDATAFDSSSPYYDPRSKPSDPTWLMVDIRLLEKYDRLLPLDELRGVPGLARMELLRKGSRLSVQPVAAAEFRIIQKLAQSAPTR